MRILIIEDEKGILDFLRQGLDEESYAVDTEVVKTTSGGFLCLQEFNSRKHWHIDIH